MVYTPDVYTFSDSKYCGTTSSLIKIKGFNFILKNNIFLGQKFYFDGSDVFGSHYVTEDSLYAQVVQSPNFIGVPNLIYYDLLSNDLEYLSIVDNLKKTFSINPNATFKACKLTGKVNIGLWNAPNYLLYDYFVFDFDDIFLIDSTYDYHPFSIKLSRYPDVQYPNSFNKYFLDKGLTTFDFNKSMVSGSHYFDINYSESHGAYLASWVYGDYGTCHHSYVFLVEGCFYVFKMSDFPIVNSSGDSVSFSWDVYILKNKCCLAECFGITV